MFKLGDFVEIDGLLAVVVGTSEDGSAPEDHLALWFGQPQGKRLSQRGKQGRRPEVWAVPEEYCHPAAEPKINH